MKWCFFHRRMGELFPEPKSRWSALARRHAKQCDVCREASERDQAMIRAMQGSAPSAGSEFPPFLRARIVANLDRGEARSDAGQAWWHGVRVGVLAVAVVVVLMTVWPRQGSEEPILGGVVSSQAGGDLAGDMRRVWLEERSTVWRWTELGGGPLEGEFANAIDDGRRLFAAVVHSCVPDETAELLVAQAESWIAPRR